MKHKKRGLLKLLLAALVAVMLLGIPCSASAKTVASIGKKNYSSLTKALAAVKSGQTVKLKANVTADTVKLNRNVKYTLDLNGKKLTAIDLYVQKGTVTIQNGSIFGGIVDGWYDEEYGDYVPRALYVHITGTSKMTVKSVKVGSGEEEDSGVYINQGASLTVKNSSFPMMCEIRNKGKLTFAGGTVKGNWAGKIKNYGTMTVIGGKIYVPVVCEKGASLTVKGGTLYPGSNEGYPDPAIYMKKGFNKLTISGGKVKSLAESAVVIQEKKSSKVKINTKYLTSKGKKVQYSKTWQSLEW